MDGLTVTEVNLTKDISTGEKFLNNYRLISKLGAGHNGKVYLGQNIDDGSLYAIKEISKVTKISILNKDPNDQINRINNEIDIMKTIIEHPKILKLVKVLNDPKFRKIFLILEYCSKGELKFGKSMKYDIALLQAITRDAVLGLEYLHGIGIIHRDIKPSNLLRNDENFVKISDFGISFNSRMDNKMNLKRFGTPAFLAPELVSNESDKEIDGMIDVWALGVSVYCLWFGELPFNGNNEYDLFEKIRNDPIDYNKVDKTDDSLISLLKGLLEKDPKKRTSIQDLKTHPFLLQGLSQDEINQFQNFNKTYLDQRTKTNFIRNNSIQRKFKSIFRRKSITNVESPKFTISPTATTATTTSTPTPVPFDIINASPTVREAPALSGVTVTKSSTSSASSTSSTSTTTATTESSTAATTTATTPIPSHIIQQLNKSTNSLSAPNQIPSSTTSTTTTSTTTTATTTAATNIPTSALETAESGTFLLPRPFLQQPSKSSSQIPTSTSPHHRPLLRKLATSSNSLNLNSLLKSKKDVPDYLDDSTYFQTLDSSSSESDSEDDTDSGDGLYNDDEDTLSFRIGPKRAASSLQMATVNELLDI